MNLFLFAIFGAIATVMLFKFSNDCDRHGKIRWVVMSVVSFTLSIILGLFSIMCTVVFIEHVPDYFSQQAQIEDHMRLRQDIVNMADLYATNLDISNPIIMESYMNLQERAREFNDDVARAELYGDNWLLEYLAYNPTYRGVALIQNVH